MDLNLGKRFAVVTGASRGLGKAITEALLAEGVRVLGVARSFDGQDWELARAKYGESFFYFETDLSQHKGISKVLKFLENAGLEPDILVNNVGGNLDMTEALSSPEDFWQVMKFNLESAVMLNSKLIPGMVSRGWGRICHVSSISSLENQGVPSYSAAKAALNAYIRGVSRSVAPDNVVLTGVLPGAVFTEGGYWDEQSRKRPDHVRKYLEERMAIRRFGTPAEIANIVTFLVSDLASFMTGSLVLADGGQGKVFFEGGS